jgi:hypothetical protein
MRYLWDLKNLGTPTLGGIKHLFSIFFNIFENMGGGAANRPDIMIANSQFVAIVYGSIGGEKSTILSPSLISMMDLFLLVKIEKTILLLVPRLSLTSVGIFYWSVLVNKYSFEIDW